MQRHPEFPHRNDFVHLNHAGVAPWPSRTTRAVAAFADENMIQGSLDYQHWLLIEAETRQWLAELIHVDAEEIALLKNTSEGLSVVAWGLEWQPGDNVVFAAEEFPSNRVVWESLTELGVEPRKVSIGGQNDPEAALLEACDRRTRLLACSAVQYASGLCMDLERLGEACHAQGILFCVDAIQQIGALPFDAREIRADFVVADAHKWLLSPEGIALFWCRAGVRDRLKLRQYGWHMLDDTSDFDRQDWRPARDARRFECGSPNMTGIHALHASLSLIRETGIQQIARNIFNNVIYLHEKLSEIDRISSCLPKVAERRSGILAIDVAATDMQDLYRRLMHEQLFCALRGGRLRLSPHFYHTRDELDHAVAIITDALT